MSQGFRRGYSRTWTNPGGDALFESVYEWGTPADAAQYARGLAEGRAESVPVPAPESPPFAGAFAQRYFDQVTFHNVAFSVGRRSFLLNLGLADRQALRCSR